MRTFEEVRDELEKIIAEEGLVEVKVAAKERGVTRSAILQLIKRGRLNVKTVLGKPLVYKSEVQNFKEQKPGPAPNTIFRRSANG